MFVMLQEGNQKCVAECNGMAGWSLGEQAGEHESYCSMLNQYVFDEQRLFPVTASHHQAARTVAPECVVQRPRFSESSTLDSACTCLMPSQATIQWGPAGHDACVWLAACGAVDDCQGMGAEGESDRL